MKYNRCNICKVEIKVRPIVCVKFLFRVMKWCMMYSCFYILCNVHSNKIEIHKLFCQTYIHKIHSTVRQEWTIFHKWKWHFCVIMKSATIAREQHESKLRWFVMWMCRLLIYCAAKQQYEISGKEDAFFICSIKVKKNVHCALCSDCKMFILQTTAYVSDFSKMLEFNKKRL